MSAPSAVAERAPAKLNLGLRVLGRRPDGFHELDSLFVRLDIADTVTLRAAPGAAADRLLRCPAGIATLDDLPLTTGPDNLVLRAVAAYRAAAAVQGVAVEPVEVTLTKRIPWGAGLAGGSADAAATLRALARVWPAGVALAPLAERLGSDVPFALADVRAARVRGRGERIEPIDLGEIHLVLANPGAQVSAADAFRWWSDRPVDVPAPAAAAPVNALEVAVAGRVPAVAAALTALRSLDAGPVAMSGSGSTCFARVADAHTAAGAARALAERQPTWWVVAARVA